MEENSFGNKLKRLDLLAMIESVFGQKGAGA
jgi:hypothetical protein